MKSVDIEQQGGGQTDSLMAIDAASPSPTRTSTQHACDNDARISQRLAAVRPEVINALSFLSIVWSLYEQGEPSCVKTVFVSTGILLLVIDVYFIHCQWNLKTTHSIAVVIPWCRYCHCWKNAWMRRTSINSSSSTASTEALDDLLSDLPQSLWVLLYLWNFQFSIIAMICALHSFFSLAQDLAKM